MADTTKIKLPSPLVLFGRPEQKAALFEDDASFCGDRSAAIVQCYSLRDQDRAVAFTGKVVGPFRTVSHHIVGTFVEGEYIAVNYFAF